MGVKINSAVKWALVIAANSAHGYDQVHRWGPDYDCSSLVISAYQQAGVAVKDAGATYTGNMLPVFLKCGFKDVTRDVNLTTARYLQYGDVLLNTVHHAAMYIGEGRIVQASINEKRHAIGGVTGDQTGREIWTRSYYNYPWDHVLRFIEPEAAVSVPCIGEPYMVKRWTVGTIKSGCKDDVSHAFVAFAQQLLNAYHCNAGKVDGEFGNQTEKAAVLFQRSNRLDPDGVVGPNTWAALLQPFK